MIEHELPCCAVRDLLPSYLEELTEAETAALVRAHLENCPSCRRAKENMGRQIPVEKTPERALRFLRRIRRTRLIAAVLSALLAIWCACWLYDQAFHYPDSEAGWLAAVEDYVPMAEDSRMSHGVKAGTPLRVIAGTVQGEYLYVAYAAENQDHVHGVLTLQRGWNGKYRPVRSTESPFPYTAGIAWEEVGLPDSGEELYALVGDGCREIYRIQVAYHVVLEGSDELQVYEKTYEITEPDFLWLMDLEELEDSLGVERGTILRVAGVSTVLLDRENRDVTDHYRAETAGNTWGGGKGTAEQFLVYIYMGIVLAFGGILIRYFFRKD